MNARFVALDLATLPVKGGTNANTWEPNRMSVNFVMNLSNGLDN